jgi:hypothetical protein
MAPSSAGTIELTADFVLDPYLPRKRDTSVGKFPPGVRLRRLRRIIDIVLENSAWHQPRRYTVGLDNGYHTASGHGMMLP